VPLFPHVALGSQCLFSYSKDIFYWDANGDRNNLVYGSLYRTDVPLYYRQKFAIGLPPGTKPFSSLPRPSSPVGCLVLGPDRSDAGERLTFSKAGYIFYQYDSPSQTAVRRYCSAEQVLFHSFLSSSNSLSNNIISGRKIVIADHLYSAGPANARPRQNRPLG
jgi:hypothetical protein